MWAGARAISARLKNRDEVPNFRRADLDVLGEDVERRAQRSDDAEWAALANVVVAGSDGDRGVLPDDLAKVATGGQMVVEAAVGDQEDMASGNLFVDDAGDIDACFANQVTSQFQLDFSAGEALGGVCANALQGFADIC